MRSVLVVSMVVSVCAGVCCLGRTIRVEADGSGEYATIQTAIDAAVNGGEVVIMPGVYRGAGNRDIDFKGKAITVRGSDPDDPNVVAATVIDCEGSAAQPRRGFIFQSDETAGSVLKGLTITNGYADANGYAGGAILCRKAHPSIIRCVLRGNIGRKSTDWVYAGGGIAGYGSNAVILECRIESNQGGGIACYEGGILSISKCFIAYNTARSGGGILAYSGGVAIDGCVIAGNEAQVGSGGVICAPFGGGATINACEIIGNRGSGGAGIGASSGVLIINSIVAGNVASNNGGGLLCGMYGTISLLNCTIVGNRANGDGGGIWGGLSELYNPSIDLKDCIVWGNEASRGNQIAFPVGGVEVWGGLSAAFSSVQGGMAEVYRGGGTITFHGGMIDADPLFADPGGWDDNGTPGDWSDDVWVGGDYHLRSRGGRWDAGAGAWVFDDVSSPCIDAGDPASDYSLEPWWHGGRVNMGAYGGTAEASRSGWCADRPAGDLDGDCRVGLGDLAVVAGSWMECGMAPAEACDSY